ncbi:hypothetical protein OAF27_03375 [Verrucomicrobiales bacterium]|nr:hypothetical protein [Verrucomicrobiales bacterium]
MEIDENLARFPASIEDALLAPEQPEVPDAPEVQVRPRSSVADVETKPKPVTAPATAPLYFQCPSCRSTLCVPAERLENPSPAPCGHCSTLIMPPVLMAPEEAQEEAPRKRRFASGGLIPPR